jgi:hypothetical protein
LLIFRTVDSQSAGLIAIVRALQRWSCGMGNWTPSIVPSTDQTVYLVLDDFGRHGRAWCETDAEATDLETVITYLLEGQYNNPVRVVGFNAAEGWARDVSADVADELRGRCGLEGAAVPAYLEAFVHRHDRAPRRLV